MPSDYTVVATVSLSRAKSRGAFLAVGFSPLTLRSREARPLLIFSSPGVHAWVGSAKK